MPSSLSRLPLTHRHAMRAIRDRLSDTARLQVAASVLGLRDGDRALFDAVDPRQRARVASSAQTEARRIALSNPSLASTANAIASGVRGTYALIRPGAAPSDDATSSVAPSTRPRYALLMVKDIKCRKKTRVIGEFDGADDLLLLGRVFDLGQPASKAIGTGGKVALGQWTDGRYQAYPGGLKVASVNLTVPTPARWPTAAAAHLYLADDDPGNGWGEFLQKIWGDLKPGVNDALSDYLQGVLSQSGLSDELQQSLQAAAIEVAGAIIEGIVGWLGQIGADEILYNSPMHSFSPWLDSATDTWGASNESSPELFVCAGYRGEYHVRLYWKLSDQA